MLKLTLEVIPFGKDELKKTLGIVEIINDGTGDHELGNYTIYVDPDNGGDKFTIKKFIRSRGAWELVGEALSEKEAREFALEMRNYQQ